MEPELGNDTFLSFNKGERVSIKLPLTICDGLRSTTPGELTFPILEQCIQGIVCVTDDAVTAAVRYIMRDMKLIVEPSGAPSPSPHG